MLNGMRDDSSLLVELEDEEAAELFTIVLALAAAQPLSDLVDVLARADALVEHARALVPRLADRLPPHDQLLGARRHAGVREPRALDHALRDYMQLDVPNQRHPAPRDGRRPECSGVSYAPGDRGKVWVR